MTESASSLNFAHGEDILTALDRLDHALNTLPLPSTIRFFQNSLTVGMPANPHKEEPPYSETLFNWLCLYMDDVLPKPHKILREDAKLEKYSQEFGINPAYLHGQMSRTRQVHVYTDHEAPLVIPTKAFSKAVRVIDDLMMFRELLEESNPKTVSHLACSLLGRYGVQIEIGINNRPVDHPVVAALISEQAIITEHTTNPEPNKLAIASSKLGQGTLHVLSSYNPIGHTPKVDSYAKY